MTQFDPQFVFVPGGEFLMGTHPARYRGGGADELPQHTVHVPDFHIMRFPVTNEQYRAFMDATGHRAPLGWSKGYPEEQAQHPVTWVTLRDALTFCRWAGEVSGLPVRLPTEAEWEKAARGADGRLYPWGETWRAYLCNNREAKSRGTTPVGQFSPAGDSPYGVAELAGNTQDWCASLFGVYPYDPEDGRDAFATRPDLERILPAQREAGAIANPERAEASDGKQCLRGGTWRGDRQEARCAYRSWAAPMHRGDDTGFRCAYSG
jgi:serine/threonine-protein kinase